MDKQEVLNTLADADRQHILYELIENDGFSSITDLSQRIASCSDEKTDTALKHAKISLVHNHLPRLEDYGVIEYDTRGGDVVLTDAERLEPLRNIVTDLDTAAVEKV